MDAAERGDGGAVVIGAPATALTTLDGSPLTPLGIGARPGQDRRCPIEAFEGGINLFYLYGRDEEPLRLAMRAAARRNRRGVFLAAGSERREPAALRAEIDAVRRELATEALDLFFAQYFTPQEDEAALFGPDGTIAALQAARGEGAIRFTGASAHERGLALRLVEDRRIDVVMLRFNMAHRKAAAEVFPAAQQARTPVVAFTATRWRTLLAAPAEWPGPPPTAADCYRFCLAHRPVKIVLTAPTSLAELAANLRVLDAGPMDRRERARWKRYGDLIHGRGADRFETEWP